MSEEFSKKLEDIRGLPLPSLSTWAGATWPTFYYFMLTYPDQPTPEEQVKMRMFFEGSAHNLPCQNCRNHFQTHFGKIDQAVKSRVNLAEWLFSVHNDVNRRTGKKIYTWEESIEAVRKIMYGIRPNNRSHSSVVPVWGIVIIALVCIIVGIVIGFGIWHNKRGTSLRH